MSDLAKEITPVNIEAELKQSYLDYAMSVIVGRALPDVRDGLKPVHRRVLYGMHELKNDWNKPYKKSARIVGDVIGKYHPHSDTAIYDTVVRLAQPFSMRTLLVDGQGNFGSIDGDPPAAMRYTEVRLARFAHSLLVDLEKDTVDFVPNFDETEKIPVVLPTRVPNLLVNGSSGIAVGMATNIPTHNLGEVIDAVIALINDPELSIDQLMQYIPGPDFPTAGTINGRAGIVRAYRTGRGRIFVRAKMAVEVSEKGKEAIIITELPYQVNKARLIEKIAELVKEKKLEGISELRDESDKDGMRVVIEVKRGDSSEVLMNNLYNQTQLQNVYGINMVALVDGRPRVLNLKTILECFIRHRREVVTRRTVFDLRKARDRAHLLEGLGVALVNIDEMISLIKASKNPQEAKQGLLSKPWPAGMVASMLQGTGSHACRPDDDLDASYGLQPDGYRLSEVQAQAILDLKLHRLTGLEQEKIINEYQDILKLIGELLEILTNPERLLAVIQEELLQDKAQFADPRRTRIIADQEDLTTEDLITEEELVVTLSHQGYAKTQSIDNYQAQKRGGKGKIATSMKEEDFIETLLVANSHDTLLCFSSLGKVYWLKVYQIPQASRTSRGKPIVNLLPLQSDERINAITAVSEFDPNKFVFMATAFGTVKKVNLTDFSRPRNSGIIALELIEGDQLVTAAITDGKQDVMLFSDDGKAIRFDEEDVRPMGRTARGVRGMKLKTDSKIISCVIVAQADETAAILTATENGYGKRTMIADYRKIGRGGLGVISIQVTERNGAVVGAIRVSEEDEVMLISDGGTLVRTRVAEVSIIGRNTQGVRLISLSNDEKLCGLQRIEELKQDDDECQSVE